MEEQLIKKCASCFVINDNKILLIFHKKFQKYIQPGGHIEDNEEPYETAIREVYEETGIKVVIENKIPFNIQEYNTKIGKQLDYQFIGTAQNLEFNNNEESYLCGWFDIEEIKDLNVVDDLFEKIEIIKTLSR